MRSFRENPVVLVDMDGVLADFELGMITRASGLNPELIFDAPRKNFYFSDDYPAHSELLRGIPREEGFFEELPLVEGALEGWQRIINYGYTPRVCSSPIGTDFCPPEKLRWLERHFVPVFGKWVVEQAIITKNKHESGGIALIDDKPFIKDFGRASWKHIVFDRPYNSESTVPRLMSWQDENLQPLLEQAANR